MHKGTLSARLILLSVPRFQLTPDCFTLAILLQAHSLSMYGASVLESGCLYTLATTFHPFLLLFPLTSTFKIVWRHFTHTDRQCLIIHHITHLIINQLLENTATIIRVWVSGVHIDTSLLNYYLSFLRQSYQSNHGVILHLNIYWESFSLLNYSLLQFVCCEYYDTIRTWRGGLGQGRLAL